MKDRYAQAYRDNQKIKEFVDKYCIKHDKEPKDAIKDYIVKEYIDNTSNEVHSPYVATYNG